MKSNKHIMIIDDEPNVRLVFRTALESAGHFVSEAGDGLSALGQLRKTPVDVILLDLRMPVLDGIETLRRLRDAGDETAVVAITAHGSVSDAVAAMKLGVIDLLPKPVSPATLREVVATAVARREMPQRLAPAMDTKAPTRRILAEDLERTQRALDRLDLDDAEFYLRVADQF